MMSEKAETAKTETDTCESRLIMVELWQPQPQFRWIEPFNMSGQCESPPRLQQLMVSNKGNERWENIPVVNVSPQEYKIYADEE